MCHASIGISHHKIFDIAIAQIEAMIESDNVLNDRGRKSVAFVQR